MSILNTTKELLEKVAKKENEGGKKELLEFFNSNDFTVAEADLLNSYGWEFTTADGKVVDYIHPSAEKSVEFEINEVEQKC